MEQLAAELCLARLEPVSEATVARIRPALAAALERSVRLPPLGLVADLLTLLEVPSPVLQGLEVPGLALRRYDDRVVGPLVVHRRRTALADAFAALPEAWRGAAVAALGERLCEEIEPGGGYWEPGALRAWLARTDAEGLDLALAAVAEPGPREVLQGRMAEMLRHPAIDWSAADVHLIRNLPRLATAAQRLLVRQVLEASSALGSGLRRAARPRARAGPVATGMEEEDKYPAGGFSALTTSGSPENLVASELVYMDDDEDGEGIDLFDVRFTEGELLYYTRDESAYMRQRRRIRVALAQDVVQARVMDPGVPWQRVVATLGALHAVVERLVDWLGEQDLQISLHPLADRTRPHETLATEADALSLVLSTWIDAGVVSVDPLPDAAAFAALVEASAKAAETDAAVDQHGAGAAEARRGPVRAQLGPKTAPGWAAVARDLAVHLT
ncbi:MAG: hypothetical protein R3F59_02090 [Myxococcota bacterium]